MDISKGFREFWPDIVAFAASALMIALYYVFLWTKSRNNPTYTIHGVNELARSLWVANVMHNPSRDVMAVQTLRNFIMGASLMASTATLLIIGTLTLSGQADSIARSWHVLNPVGSHAAESGSSRCWRCCSTSSSRFSPSPWPCAWSIMSCS